LNKSVQLLNFMFLLQYVRAHIHTHTYAISVELSMGYRLEMQHCTKFGVFKLFI